MDRNHKAELQKAFIGRIYADIPPEEMDERWDGYYPVVSAGKVIAILDCADDNDPYGAKPIVDDDYIDADAQEERLLCAKEFAAILREGEREFAVYKGRGLLPKPTVANKASRTALWTWSQVQRFREARQTANWTVDVVAGYATLWTDDPRNHGLDEAASAQRYVDLVRDALRIEYPLADIAVSYASHVDARDTVKVHAVRLTEDEKCVRRDIERPVHDRAEDIMGEIREAGHWYVRLAGPTPPEDYSYEVRRPWLPPNRPERWEQAYTVSRHQTYDKAARAPHSARQRDTVCGRDKDGTWRPMPGWPEGPSRPEPPQTEE